MSSNELLAVSGITPLFPKPGVGIKIPAKVGNAVIHYYQNGEKVAEKLNYFIIGRTRVLAPFTLPIGEEVITKAVVIKADQGIFLRLMPFKVEKNVSKRYELNVDYSYKDDLQKMFKKI